MIAGEYAAYPSLRETVSCQTPTSIDTKVYLSHPARFTTRIPTTWNPDDTLRYDYASRDGFISGRNLNDPDTNIASLDQASEIAASSWRFEGNARVSPRRWQGLDARSISSSSDPGAPISLVFVHPTALANGLSIYAELTTSNHFFKPTIGAVSFDPKVVTVELYVNTAADFMEAHSIMRNSIRWVELRSEALSTLSGYADTNQLWLAAGALQVLLAAIVSAGGDGHNALWTPDVVSRVAGLQASSGPTGQALGQGIGYLNIPGFSGNDDAGRAFAQSIRNLLAG